MRRRRRCVGAQSLFTLYNVIGIVCSASATTSSTEPATCATGSVNWITHTLPQQCLRTAWTSPSSANASEINTTSSSHVTAPQTSSSPVLVTAAATAQKDDITSEPSTWLNPTVASSSDSSTLSKESGSDSPSVGPAGAETDADSALHDANFLSFEEWKKQKLGDTGQSPDTLAKARGSIDHGGERHRPGAALDTLGEDSEIDLDFSGFGGATHRQSRQSPIGQEPNQYDAEDNVATASGPSAARSKDAGRTCKERFNYASFDCAANVLKTNPRCKSSSSVLVENKDSYMLNECSVDNKFLIVELCEYIQIDTVVLANFEFFSSMFRTFTVSVSDRYPVKIDKWQHLGTYEARNSREIQAFLIQNPLIWAKYIRIEFHTHYGNEFYCPLSLLRVHGTTMMEDYRHQEELVRGDPDISEEDPEPEAQNAIIAIPPIDDPAATPQAVMNFDSKEAPAQAEGVVSNQSADSEQESNGQNTNQTQNQLNGAESSSNSSSSAGVKTNPHMSESQTLSDQASPSPIVNASNAMISELKNETQSVKPLPPQTPAANVNSSSSPSVDSSHVAATGSPSHSDISNSSIPISSNNASNSLRHDSSEQLETSMSRSASSSSIDSISAMHTARPQQAQRTASNAQYPASQTVNVTSTHPQQKNSTSSPSASAQNGASPPGSTQPATQESFFKTLSKRLSLLEANATLSLQYIESQSILLREAFASVEKKQVQKTASFLATLNETVLKELTAARVDYDQLWQSTVLELAGQRDEGRREREVLNDQVRLLAEELVGQKRLMAVQATLLLVVLGLVVFTKVAPGQANDVAAGLGVGDIRILQGMQTLMQRGRSGKRASFKRPVSAGTDDGQDASRSRTYLGWESPLESPTGTRPATSHGMNETHEDAWDDLLAFVDENVRPRASRGKSYLKQKPLPPAPKTGFERIHSDLDESEEMNDSSSAATPFLAQRTDGTMDMEPEVQNPGLLGVAGRMPAERRGSAMRIAKSAPTTPQVERPEPVFEQTPYDRSAEGSEGGGISDGASSVGLGIDIDG